MKKIKDYIRQQWALYLLAVIVLFASMEIAMRTHEAAVASLQDGVLLKMRMFLTRDKTDILFLGTSRTQDGINPTLIAEEMGKLDVNWKDARAFNGAAAGGSLMRLDYCVDKAITKPGLRLLGLELSDAQLADHRLWSPSPNADKEPTNFEERLQQGLSDYSYIIRYRKTFRLENALKYPFLMFPNIDDGTRWFGQVGGFAKKGPNLNGSDQQALTFIRVTQTLPVDASNLFPASERFISVYRQMAEKARNRGIQVFLYMPPVRGTAHVECDEAHLQIFQRIAEGAQVPLLYYACQNFPPRYFADDSHMTVEGKDIWSTQLAKDLVEVVDGQGR